MAGMDPRRLSVTPSSGGSSSGTGGRSVGTTTSRRRRRMSNPSSGTRLMPQFNAAAADGWGSGWSSLGGFEFALDEWHLHNIQFHPLLEAPPTILPTPHQLERLLFLGSPMRSPAADDNVLIMDGVLVGNSGSRIASSTRRSVSFSGPGLVAAGSPGSRGGGSGSGSSSDLLLGLLGSGDGGHFGSNGQFAQGREGPRRMQTMRPRFSEVVSRSSGRSIIGYPNMQGSPINPYLFPPSLPGPAFHAAAPRAFSSYTDAAFTIRPPASNFTPPRVTVTVARPSSSTQRQPETMPATTSFAWPPTEDEDASIAQQLYGPTTGARRRLPVFEAICPAE